MSVPYRTAGFFWNFYRDLTLEKILFLREKRTVLSFCKSAWLTAATFSVFIFSEICTVKTLKHVTFLSKKFEVDQNQNNFPYSKKRFWFKKRKIHRFFVRFGSRFWNKIGKRYKIIQRYDSRSSKIGERFYFLILYDSRFL